MDPQCSSDLGKLKWLHTENVSRQEGHLLKPQLESSSVALAAEKPRRRTERKEDTSTNSQVLTLPGAQSDWRALWPSHPLLHGSLNSKRRIHFTEHTG